MCSGPEWYISTIICLRYIPFWPRTLEIKPENISVQNVQLSDEVSCRLLFQLQILTFTSGTPAFCPLSVCVCKVNDSCVASSNCVQVNTNVCKPQMFCSIQKQYRNMYKQQNVGTCKSATVQNTSTHRDCTDFMESARWCGLHNTAEGSKLCTM